MPRRVELKVFKKFSFPDGLMCSMAKKENKIARSDGDVGAEGEARRKDESLSEKDEPRYYHSMTETAVL